MLILGILLFGLFAVVCLCVAGGKFAGQKDIDGTGMLVVGLVCLALSIFSAGFWTRSLVGPVKDLNNGEIYRLAGQVQATSATHVAVVVDGSGQPYAVIVAEPFAETVTFVKRHESKLLPEPTPPECESKPEAESPAEEPNKNFAGNPW